MFNTVNITEKKYDFHFQRSVTSTNGTERRSWTMEYSQALYWQRAIEDHIPGCVQRATQFFATYDGNISIFQFSKHCRSMWWHRRKDGGKLLTLDYISTNSNIIIKYYKFRMFAPLSFLLTHQTGFDSTNLLIHY